MEFLKEGDIFTNCTIIKEQIDLNVSIEDGHELSKYLQELSSYVGLASFVNASAVYHYQSKKTPESVALKKYTEELSDKISKRMSCVQSLLNQLKSEKINSKYSA